MSFDVLESLNSVVGGPVTRQLSALLGESENSTHTALRAAGPSLLAGLMQHATTPSGATDVFNIVQDNRIDAGIAGKLGDILGNRGAVDSLRGVGESLLGSVFGTRSGAVTNAVSQVSGVQPHSALTLLSMGLPLLLGLLRKQTSSAGLNASGLASLLFTQRSALEKAGLDNRITGALGANSLGSLLSAIPGAGMAQAATARLSSTLPEQRKRGGWLPWALAAGVAALGVFLMFNRSDHRAGVPAQSAATTSDVASGKRTHLASADDTTRVYFGSGGTAIDGSERLKIASVAQSAKEQDRTVTVTGYTDRTGDHAQNLAIAKDRAAAVRDALVAEGVGESKVVMDPPAEVTGSGSDAEARRVDIEMR